jgi:hypothetical protein
MVDLGVNGRIENGIFHHRLGILDNFYEDEWLPFFYCSLCVPLYPKIRHHCNLWLGWISNDHQGSVADCCSVWRIFLKHWTKLSDKIKQHLGRGPLKLLDYTSIGDIQPSALNETFIPNDLKLKELFMGAYASRFAWHPNLSDPNIPLDSLFSIYIHLGPWNISQAT